jgi:hypothetical protein
MKVLTMIALAVVSATSYSGTWAFHSATSEVVTFNGGSEMAANIGPWAGNGSWIQLVLSLGKTVSNGGSYDNGGNAQGRAFYKFVYNPSYPGDTPGGSTVGGIFRGYIRCNVSLSIGGAATPLSGFSASGKSTIIYSPTADIYKLASVAGQQTNQRTAANFFNYPSSETYPYLGAEVPGTGNIPATGYISYDATLSKYVADFTVYTWNLQAEATLTSGANSALVWAAITTAMTIEPEQVGSSYFTVSSPFGGSGD